MTSDKFNILLVDDEPSAIKLMERVLNDGTHRVYTRESAEAALEFLGSHSVDLLISDHQMGGMTGIEFFEQLNQSHPEILKILITGKAEFEDLIYTINRTDTFRVLIKPFNVDEFVNSVNKAKALSKAHQKAKLFQSVQEELKKKEFQFWNLIESLHDAIIVTDTEGAVLFVNKACETLFLKNKAEFIGKPFGMPVIPGQSVEIDIPRGKDHPAVGEMRTFPVDWQGSSALLSSIRDISDRKFLEKNLRETVFELARANDTILKNQQSLLEQERLRVLIQMTGATAHELNQPLTVLMGNLDLLNMVKHDQVELSKIIEKIFKSGVKISEIVRRIQLVRYDENRSYAGGNTIIDFHQKIRLLCVVSNGDDFNRISDTLKDFEFSLKHVTNTEDMIRQMKAAFFDIILLEDTLSDKPDLVFDAVLTYQDNAGVIIISESTQWQDRYPDQTKVIFDTIKPVKICSDSFRRLVLNNLEKCKLQKEIQMTSRRFEEISTSDPSLI